MSPIADYAEFSKDGLRNQKAIFSHELVSKQLGDLILMVNPNEITWSYGLNTANYPTYGGEVVQILSMFFDDMTITGDVRAYSDIEKIYRWFILYMQIATQGNTGHGSFNPSPVTFRYPERGWEFKILPKQMPGFRYGRDVVAPSYTIVAAVAEPDASVSAKIMDVATFDAQHHSDTFDPFGKATAAIGYIEDNPFSGPTNQIYSKPDALKQGNKALADWFNNLIPSYTSGKFPDLEVSSKPPSFVSKFTGGSTTKKGSKTTKKK